MTPEERKRGQAKVCPRSVPFCFSEWNLAYAAVTMLRMPLFEADTHANLVNPAIYTRRWTADQIKLKEHLAAVERPVSLLRTAIVGGGGND